MADEFPAIIKSKTHMPELSYNRVEAGILGSSGGTKPWNLMHDDDMTTSSTRCSDSRSLRTRTPPPRITRLLSHRLWPCANETLATGAHRLDKRAAGA